MEDFWKAEPSGFTGRTVMDIHEELKGAKRTFWFMLLFVPIGRSMEKITHKYTSLGVEVTTLILSLALFVAIILHIRKVARTASAAGYSPTGWGIMSFCLPITVWFLNGRIKRQYGTYPKMTEESVKERTA